MSSYRVGCLMAFVLVPLSVPVFAQTSGPPPAQEHQHHMPAGANAPTWTFMQDGIVFGMFNHQGVIGYCVGSLSVVNVGARHQGSGIIVLATKKNRKE